MKLYPYTFFHIEFFHNIPPRWYLCLFMNLRITTVIGGFSSHYRCSISYNYTAFFAHKTIISCRYKFSIQVFVCCCCCFMLKILRPHERATTINSSAQTAIVTFKSNFSVPECCGGRYFRNRVYCCCE